MPGADSEERKEAPRPAGAASSVRLRLRSRLWNDQQNPSVTYILPFVVFMLFLAVGRYLPLSPAIESPLRVCLLAAVCWLCWPAECSFVPRAPIATVLLGVAVFALWIAPDVLVPGYRQSLLFNNHLFGIGQSSSPDASHWSAWLLSWRFARAALIVPIVEELFWRAWLLRWVIRVDFWRVPMGTYETKSFFVVAGLFALEHGSYWDVGLLTGILYNWWMVRTKSVADCILAHAVTNACLSAYVIARGQWQYWP